MSPGMEIEVPRSHRVGACRIASEGLRPVGAGQGQLSACVEFSRGEGIRPAALPEKVLTTQ